MLKIAIHGRRVKPDSFDEIRALLDTLNSEGLEVIFSKTFTSSNTDLFDFDKEIVYQDNLNPGEVDFVFSLGGDGTLLEAATHVGRTEIPILGINTGRLGFLATISKEDVQHAIKLLLDGKFTVESRSLIQLLSPRDLFGEKNFALNEAAILRRDSSSMISVKCFLNEDYLNTYWADGLMVSTPTGSTGYSLSCGGPILMPSSQNFILTPVSPHNLNIRPLVIPDNGILRFEIDSRDTKLLLSLDSRSSTIENGTEIKVKKADFSARLVTLDGSSFVETLRNKLGWGFDKRN